MNMQNYHFDYYQYTKKINKKSKLSFLVLILLSITLLITAIVIKPQNTHKIDFYFVEICSFPTYNQANILSQEIQNSGGAGYIYFDGNYKVLASYYATESEAEKVVENISNQYPKSCTYTLSTHDVRYLKVNSSLKDIFLSMSDVCLTSFKKLSSLLISFDKNEISSSSLKVEFKQLSHEFETISSKFLNLTNKDPKFNLHKEYILNLSTAFANFYSFEKTNNPNSYLKYNLVSLVVNYHSFISLV